MATPTPATAPAPSGSGKKEVVLRYACNMCTKVISGTRHRCSVCEDFDLCEACLRAAPVPPHDVLHPMQSYAIDGSGNGHRRSPSSFPSFLPARFSNRRPEAAAATALDDDDGPIAAPPAPSPPSSSPLPPASPAAVQKPPPLPPGKRQRMSKREAEAFKAEMTALLREIDDTHARITKLTAVLDSKLSKQLIKGLLKAYDK